MPIKINCPGCNRNLQLKERLIGQSVRCPACKAVFVAAIDRADAQVAPTEDSSAPLPPVPTSPAPSSPAALNRIARFAIKAALGQGGFGTVYRAYDPILDREVALKVPRPGAKGAERLVREARAAAPLRHPNIVAVYEAGADGDELYIATEFVEGRTLADEAEQKPVDPHVASEWVKSLAEGLDYAHQERIVHRDVKPQNIMIGVSGRAQLMDFGLASSVRDEERDAGISGTPAYMAPEQARGETEKIGPSADQYSLGAVLYELLTGSKPFHGGQETIAQIAAGTSPRSPRSVRPGISRDLEAVCLKAMAIDPARRYLHCRAMAEDLGRWLNDELVQARRHSPWEILAYWARKRPAMFGWTAAALCLAALLLGGGIASGILYLSRPAPSGNSPAVTLASAVGQAQTPKLPPSPGTPSNATADLQAETHLYGRLLDRTRFAYAQQDVVLADRWLEQTNWQFRNWEYDYLRRIVTGGWKTIRNGAGEITALAVHPQGRRFACASASGAVSVWEIASGKRVRQLRVEQRVTSLAYSPDGKLLAIATGIEDAPEARVAGPVLDPPAPQPTPVTTAPSPAPPPGLASAAGQPQYVVILADADTLSETAAYREHSGPIASVAFAADGQWIASGGAGAAPNAAQPGNLPPGIQAGEVRLWEVSSLKTVRRLASPTGAVRRLTFLPGGRRIAAASGNGMNGQAMIWNLDSSAPIAAAGFAPGQPASVSAPVPAAGPAVAPMPIAAEVQPSPFPSTPSDVLFPELQFPGSYRALAADSRPGSAVVAAPAFQTSLLEAGRRRVAGVADVLNRMSPGMPGGEYSLRGGSPAVFDLAFASEPSPAGTIAMAAAGGDLLLRSRPGAVTLFDPSYEYGARVRHLGHTAAVTAVAFRPDGKQFISGSADGVIKIWSAEVHPEVVRLGSTRSARRVAFGRDGRYVAVAESHQSWTEARGAVTMRTADGKPIAPAERPRGSVKLYDIRDGREVISLAAGPGDLFGLAVSPQLQWAAAGGEDETVRVWDLNAGSLQFEAAAPGIVRCLAASRDGKFLAAACGGKPAMPSLAPAPGAGPIAAAPVAPISSPAPSAKIEAPKSTAAAPQAAAPASPPAGALLTPAPEEQALESASAPGMLVLWSIDDGKEVARWQAHELDALSVAFSPDGKQLVSSGADRTVRLWNVGNRVEVRKLEAFDGEIVDLAFRPTGEDILGSGFDPCRPDEPGAAIVWSAADGKQRLALRSLSGPIYGVSYSLDGKRIATGGGVWQGSLSRPGEVIVWDAETGIELLSLAGRPGRAAKTELYTRMETYYETETREQTVTEQVMVDGQPVNREKIVKYTVCIPKTRSRASENRVEWEEPGAILGVTFSGDGRSLAAACEDGSALVWDAERCQPHDKIRWDSGRILCTAASPDGKLLAVAGESGDYCDCKGLIRCYDAKTGRLARQIETPAGPVKTVAFTPDSKRLVTGGGCGEWFPMTCEPGHDAAPIRPDVLARFPVAKQSAPITGRAEAWDVASGERVCEFAGHNQAVASVSVRPQDGRIATGAADGTVRWWDASSGKELGRWSDLGQVTSVAFSPDGRQLAAATSEGKVWLGSPGGASPSALASEGLRSAAAVAFDPSGKRLAVLSMPGPATTGSASKRGLTDGGSVPRMIFPPAPNTVYVWNVDAPGKPRLLELHAPAWSMAFDHASGLLATGGVDGGARLLNFETGGERLHLPGDGWPAIAVAMPEGDLASLDHRRELRVWRVARSQQRQAQCSQCAPPRQPTVELERPNPQMFLYKVRYSRDGKFAATGGHAMRQTGPMVAHPVRTVDAKSGKSQHGGGHHAPVESVAARPDGRQFASVGHDKNLYLWNEDGTSLPTKPLPNVGWKVVYSPDGKLLAVATADDGLVSLHDSNTAEEVRRFQVEPTAAFGLVFNRDGKQLVTGGLSGKIKVWNVETGTLEREWPGHDGTIYSVALSRDGRLLASCGHDKTVKLWDFETGESVKTLEGFGGPVRDCAFAPDGKRLAAGAFEPIVRVFDVEGGQVVKELPDHGQGVWSLAFSPEGDRLACCGQMSPLAVWNWEAGEKLSTNAEAGQCLAWRPDGLQLIAGSVANRPPPQPQYDAIITLYDGATARLVDTIILPDISRPEFDLSPDGRYVVVGRQDGTAVVWDRKGKQLVAECRGHQGPVRDVSFHPQGDFFATAGQDGTIRLWSPQGAELASLPQGSPVNCVLFDPTGKLLAAGDVSRGVQLWDINASEMAKADAPRREVVWIDDAPPAGARLLGDSPWVFVSAPDHPVLSGKKAMHRQAAGQSQHYYEGSQRKLRLSAGDVLFAYVYLDPKDPPRTLMLQFQQGDWEHRAVWGEDAINFGAPNTPARRLMGGLPEKGKWVRLEVKAEEIGLPAGSEIGGWAFTQLGGNVYWDKAGVVTRTPQPLRLLSGHYGEVIALAFNGDGSQLAATSRAFASNGWIGDLKVWDVESGERRLSIPSHTWWEAGIAFHPTQPHIASTGKEHTLQIFDAETGQLLLSLPTRGHLVSSVAFNRNGSRLLATLAGSAKLVDPAPEAKAFGTSPRTPIRPDPAEAAAARWVLEQGGQVQVLVDGVAPLDVLQPADLPGDPYLVSRIALAGKDTIQDDDLQRLQPLKRLVSIRLDLPKLTDAGLAWLGEATELEELFLNRTGLTDDGLKAFSKLAKLRLLHASDTRITGAGLIHLVGCGALENIELHRTPLNDAGLDAAAELAGLKVLGVAGTKATDEGIAKLKNKKPDLNLGR